MAKKYYAKRAVYILPAGDRGITYMDGIYIDGQLFENNIPVRDGVIRIDLQPQNEHSVHHWANFGFPSYQNGQVIRIGHNFGWSPGEDYAQYHDLEYGGHPYGMGLNTIAIQLTAALPITRDIVYDVLMAFVMEVG